MQILKSCKETGQVVVKIVIKSIKNEWRIYISIMITWIHLKLQSKQKGAQDEEHFIFAVGEAIFVGWFTFEYIIRFIAAPQKWKWVHESILE